jgi:hypothetical protein
MFTISDYENAEPTFDEEADTEDEQDPGALFPIRTSISITKPTGGALSIEAQVQDGIFSIETVSYYKDAKLANDLTADSDYKRRGTYVGPQFEHLDINLQEGFEAFLAERGIDESLALLIPEFAEWKEQRVRYLIANVMHRVSLTIAFFRNTLTGSRESSTSLLLRRIPFLLTFLLNFTSFILKQNPRAPER